jgi:hypothetical protein
MEAEVAGTPKYQFLFCGIFAAYRKEVALPETIVGGQPIARQGYLSE